MFIRELSQNNNTITGSINTDKCHPGSVNIALKTDNSNNPELIYINLSRDKVKNFLVDLLVDLENSRHIGDNHGF